VRPGVVEAGCHIAPAKFRLGPPRQLTCTLLLTALLSMVNSFRSAFIPICCLALALPAKADPVAELKAFSAFKDVNLEKLASGTVQTARGATMTFPRGLAVESVYVVRKPLQKTVDFHQHWTPTSHPELKVLVHAVLPAKPTAADFQKIESVAQNNAVKAWTAATQKLGTGATELQLSNAEAQAYSKAGSPAAFWSNVLAQRSQAYVSGGPAKLPAYETRGEATRPAEEISRLLKEAPKVRSQFSALIDSAPLTGGKGAGAPTLYWEMIDVEGQAALNLGAVYSKKTADGWQTLEGAYYASSGYYVLLTLSQFWPVMIGGQEGTLVWRGQMISADSLSTLRGVERMGSGTAMMRETKRSIEVFVKDAAKAP